MNDTSPEIENTINSMMASKTPEQKLKMVFSMFESGKKMIRAGLEKEKGSPLNESEIKTGIFLRLYENSFSRDEIENILKSITK
jgi:hypothetical protein